MGEDINRVSILERREIEALIAVPLINAYVEEFGRDFALVEGFNPKINLTRTQTIMEGADYCDFRFTMPDSFI
jgi:hypothetical protein